MLWEHVFITVEDGSEVHGARARSWCLRRYPEYVNDRVKRIVVLKNRHGNITADASVREFLSELLPGTVRFSVPASVPAPSTASVRRAEANPIRREPPLIEMYFDADRDGAVDDIPTNSKEWNWGNGRGAIVLVRTCDWDGGEQVDRTPFELQMRNGPTQDWRATLSIDHPDRVRIHRSNRGEDLLLGDSVPGPLDLNADAQLSRELSGGRRVRLWAEATKYPASAAEPDWRVLLTLNFRHRRSEIDQFACLRVAPWLMASDLDETQKVYVIDFTGSAITTGTKRILNTTVRTELGTWASGAGATLQSAATSASVKQRYLRDVMRFGTQSGPQKCHSVVLRGNNETLNLGIAKGLTGRQTDTVGYLEVGSKSPTDLETGGNMVVSPPTRNYPFGRIVMGTVAKGGVPRWQGFFTAQRFQKPVKIDTSWLNVGHSDEIVAFVPKATGGYCMLIASPRQAYSILTGINLAAIPALRAANQASHDTAVGSFTAALDVATPIDFRSTLNGVARGLAAGDGCLGFDRFDNGLASQQRWIDEFLLKDPFLAVLSAWPAGGKARVEQEAETYLRTYLERLRDAAAGAHQRNTFTALAARALQRETNPGAKQPWDSQQVTVLKNRQLTGLIRGLEAAYTANPQAAIALELGKLYALPDLEIQNLQEAQRWIALSGDPLIGSFPPPLSAAQIQSAWTHIPAIAGRLLSPTDARPDTPSRGDIDEAVRADFGVRPEVWARCAGFLKDGMVLQIKLDKIREQLKTELGIVETDVIDVPMIYTSMGESIVGDMVNFVMLNSAGGCRCIVPKPFGPIVGGVDLFEDYFRQQLQTRGINVTFIDEWYEYHLDGGEIHCGTNQLPDTRQPRQWWRQAPP